MHKPLVLGSCKWILRVIKLNDYLEFFPVPDGWKLEFEKEGFDLSSSTLKEFLDVCVCLEEAELQKLLKKKIAHSIKEHDDSDRKKSKSHHGTCQGQSKHYEKHQLIKHQGGKRKKQFCDYHGLCYHSTDECDFVQAGRKHVQSTH
eukprot:7456153-Ditylum_brightwellii.AAC.1